MFSVHSDILNILLIIISPKVKKNPKCIGFSCLDFFSDFGFLGVVSKKAGSWACWKNLEVEGKRTKSSQEISCMKNGSYLFQRPSLSSSSEVDVMRDGTTELSPVECSRWHMSVWRASKKLENSA
jgi:hypothetical protein